jgi:hypothetical protein
MKRYLFVIIVFIFCIPAGHAKELSLLDPNFAIEMGGSYCTISDFSPAANKVIDSLVWANARETTGFSGNIYLVANVHAKMALRFGFEVLVPRTLNNIQGSIYSIDIINGKTTTYSMIPTVGWDMFYYTSKRVRAFVGAEFGYAMLRSNSEWHYTSIGQELGGTDFTEKMSAGTVSMAPYTGIELAFVDRYSLVLKLGYRILKYRTITDSTNTTVLNMDGTGLTYDFSGINANMSFRIYF